MTQADFLKVVQKTIEKCTSILESKDSDYTAKNDRLHVFRSAAALTGQTMRSALAGMMLKHTVSIYDMCFDDKMHSVSQWDEKVLDNINYLLLLMAIVYDEAGIRVGLDRLEEGDSAIRDEQISSPKEEYANLKKSTTELLTRLAECAEFCDANEWELPITMGNDIRSAIELIMTLTKETPSSNPFDAFGNWNFAGYDMARDDARVVWVCTKCGYKRLAGWEAPGYACPECTGRDASNINYLSKHTTSKESINA